MPNSSYKKRKDRGKCIKDDRHTLSKDDIEAGHSICKPCRADMRTDIGAERQRRRDQGLCPQCGGPTEGEKSCLRHMLKVKDGDDFVGPIMKSRGWARRKASGGGTGGR